MLVAGKKGREARKRALETLALVDLEGQATQRPAELSGGQQQRVTIARALVNRPALVWADEPTVALDSETNGEIMDLLSQLNREYEQTFVLVTHDPSVAARGDRTVFMRDGAIESDRQNRQPAGE